MLTPNVHFTTWDDYAIMSMVEGGLGISMLPQLILKRVSYPSRNPAIKAAYCSLSGSSYSTCRLRRVVVTASFVMGLYPSFSVFFHQIPTPLFCHDGSLSKLIPCWKRSSFLYATDCPSSCLVAACTESPSFLSIQ